MGPARRRRQRALIFVSRARPIAFFVLQCTLVLMLGPRCQGQFASAGQASSPQEFDAYLEVLSKTSPREVLSATRDFNQLWPQSNLLAHVFELELEAYRSIGDSAGAILAGEKALRVAPDNLVVLTNLSEIIANSTADPQQLARAEQYARKELEMSKTMRVPKRISPEEWDEIQGRLGSTAHATLGLVAYKRGDVTTAVVELEAAVKLAPTPDPIQYYRLGRLYRTRGDETEGIQMLLRAAESSDPTIRQLAERELHAVSRKTRSN